ncbi:MAG: 50S ribosomal protein L9, partial [Burkholderiales bacterium]
LEKNQSDVLARAQAAAAGLEGLMLQITQKAGVDGKLFGSVTNVDVAELLNKQGFDVSRAAIRMPDGPLKQVGDHALTVTLHADIVATITVSVLGES